MLPARADEGAPHRQRMAGWIKPPPGGDPLDAVYCPHGHHIPRRRIVRYHESGVVVCEHMTARNVPCGAQLLVLRVYRPVHDAGKALRRLYVAEIGREEVEYLHQSAEGRDVYEMLAWLGLSYPGVASARGTR